jgi:hypothetical protein
VAPTPKCRKPAGTSRGPSETHQKGESICTRKLAHKNRTSKKANRPTSLPTASLDRSSTRTRVAVIANGVTDAANNDGSSEAIDSDAVAGNATNPNITEPTQKKKRTLADAARKKLEKIGKPPEAPSSPEALKQDAGDPFDPARLRLKQDFGASLGVKKLTTLVPVRKPQRHE